MKTKTIMPKYFRDYAIYLVLVFEIIIFGILSPALFSTTNVMNMWRSLSFLAVVGIGEALVILVGCIDLSVGYQVTFVNIWCAYLIVHMGVAWPIAIILSIITCVIIGYVNGLLVTLTGMPPMIATLSMMTILEGVSYMICNGKSIYGFSDAFVQLGQGKLFGIIPYPAILMTVCLFVGWILLNKTYFGRYLFAIGGNEEAARLSGIPVNRYKRIVYAICGFFCGLSACFLLARLNSGSVTTGNDYAFDAMTCIVLGGVSISGGKMKISNIVAGVFIIEVLETGFVLVNVGEYPQMVVKGIILILAVSFDYIQHARALKRA